MSVQWCAYSWCCVVTLHLTVDIITSYFQQWRNYHELYRVLCCTAVILENILNHSASIHYRGSGLQDDHLQFARSVLHSGRTQGLGLLRLCLGPSSSLHHCPHHNTSTASHCRGWWPLGNQPGCTVLYCTDTQASLYTAVMYTRQLQLWGRGHHKYVASRCQ